MSLLIYVVLDYLYFVDYTHQPEVLSFSPTPPFSPAFFTPAPIRRQMAVVRPLLGSHWCCDPVPPCSGREGLRRWLAGTPLPPTPARCCGLKAAAFCRILHRRGLVVKGRRETGQKERILVRIIPLPLLPHFSGQLSGEPTPVHNLPKRSQIYDQGCLMII